MIDVQEFSIRKRVEGMKCIGEGNASELGELPSSARSWRNGLKEKRWREEERYLARPGVP